MNGGARHIYYLNPVQLEIILRYFTINQPFAIMSSAFGKASVAILILRIIGPNTFWRKWFLYINLGLYMLISALCSIFAFVRCSPVRALWEVQLLPTAKCWSNTSWIGVSIFQSCKIFPKRETVQTDPRNSLWRFHGFRSRSIPHHDRLELKTRHEEEDWTLFASWNRSIVKALLNPS